MNQIKSKILRFGPIKWRSASWLQNENLKQLSDDAMTKIANSLRKNEFVQPFNVWQDKKGKIWILDGVHRQKAMLKLEEEGVKISDTLPANFIDCKNKKEAAKLVLVYSSNYAKVTEEGLKEFCEINDLLLQKVSEETEIDGIDYSLFNEIEEDGDLSMIEKAKNLSDVYIVIGEYRILLERKIYEEWIEELKTKVGFDKLSVMKEIKKRLKVK